ncbi:glutamate--tRNA ligase, partial [Bacillus pumilus]
VELTELFFKEKIKYNQESKEVLAEEQVPEVIASFAVQLERLESCTPDEIKTAIKAVQKETGHKGKKLIMQMRVAVTGQTHDPEIPQSIE